MESGLNDLPVELLYDLQLYALSDTLPHVSRRFYRVFRSAPPSFHAQYILGRIGDKRGVITMALRYPICTIEVFDALCRYAADNLYLREDPPELPRRFFRSLTFPRADGRLSGWTEQDAPLPFLRHLFNHASIRGPYVQHQDDYSLIQAGRAGFLPLLIFLLQCNPRLPTPLTWAARNGHEQVAELLLAQDAVDVNAKDKYGLTALLFAAAAGHEKVVKLLLEQDDVDVNLKDNGGQTALSFAAVAGRENVVKLLLARSDIKVNSKDNKGRTALSFAVRGGHEKTVELLLARDDVALNLADIWAQTPLSWATIRGRVNVMRSLLQRDDVDVNSADLRGRTSLFDIRTRAGECGEAAAGKR